MPACEITVFPCLLALYSSNICFKIKRLMGLCVYLVRDRGKLRESGADLRNRVDRAVDHFGGCAQKCARK